MPDVRIDQLTATPYTPYSVAQATNEVREFMQSYASSIGSAMWANQAITTSTSVPNTPTYVVTNAVVTHQQPQKEKQMTQATFQNKHRTVPAHGEDGYELWVETLSPYVATGRESEAVWVSNRMVRHDAHKLVWAVQQFRMHLALFKEGLCEMPDVYDLTRENVDIAHTEDSAGVIRMQGKMLLVDGTILKVHSYVTSNTYHNDPLRREATQEIHEWLRQEARQRLSAMMDALHNTPLIELVATVKRNADNPSADVAGIYVLRHRPVQSFVNYKPLPSHQKLFYNHELYSPAQTLHSVNHLISVVRNTRPWFEREVTNHKLHEAVAQAMHLAPADNWHNLILEWPHISVGDKSKIAYTRDDRAGDSDKQTVTSVGKYIRRHFTALPDHEVRAIAALYVADECKFVTTMDDMIYQIQNGAGSCMNWKDADAEHHPYNTYDPKYGWHMAVRMEGSTPMGRALCMTDPDNGNKFFVRSYRRVDGYSPADEALEAWLTSKGYEKRRGWAGCSLKYIPQRDSFLAPYLDGNDQHVCIQSFAGEQYLTIDDEGDYICNNTDGRPDDNNADRSCCEHCEDYFDDGDGYWVGRGEDVHVCHHCFDNYFVSVLGRNAHEYYVNSDDAVWIDSQDRHFHDAYLSDNGIIQLADGEYEHEDNCVCVERDGDYYLEDDSNIVYCAHSEQYELANNCVQLTDSEWAHEDDVWQCQHSDEYYLDDGADDERRQASDGLYVYFEYLEEYEQTLIEQAAKHAATQAEVI